MEKTISTGVFDRYGTSTLGARVFYIILAFSLLWGLVGTAILASMTSNWRPNTLEIILLGLGVPILGVIISVKSNNPLISFMGYNMIVVPFGLILGPVINQYKPNIVQNAFTMTASITALMGLAGISYPRVFENMGGSLFMALTGLIFVRIFQMFIPGLQGVGVIDYIAAGIFSLYIGYDMYRANSIPKTADNAIDISIDLYLDIINLFLNILRIMGKKD